MPDCKGAQQVQLKGTYRLNRSEACMRSDSISTCKADLCQVARGPGRHSSEAWRLRSSGGKMGSCGGFSCFSSATICLSWLLLMTWPSEQSHGLPVLGHTCTPYVLFKAGCAHWTTGSRWIIDVGLLHKTHSNAAEQPLQG